MELLLKDLGIFTIIAGLLTFIIRSFISKYFDKRIKEYELELCNKSDLFKSELELQSQKHKNDLDIHFTKASRFHEKRLVTISELYKKIVDLRIYLTNLTVSFKESTGNLDADREFELQRQKKAGKAYDKFRDFYDKNRIFISKETCKLIDSLKTESFSVLSDYHFNENFYGDEPTTFSKEMWMEMKKRVRETIPAILTELESDFRGTVDVESKQIEWKKLK